MKRVTYTAMIGCFWNVLNKLDNLSDKYIICSINSITMMYGVRILVETYDIYNQNYIYVCN